jgi:flagellar motor switch protein FliN/FliY
MTEQEAPVSAAAAPDELDDVLVGANPPAQGMERVSNAAAPGAPAGPPAPETTPVTQAPSVRPITFEPLSARPEGEQVETASMDMLLDVPLRVSVELGRTRMLVRKVLELQGGSVIELDRMAGDVVDILVNDRLIARGEVVVVDDKFGVRITDLVAPSRPSLDGGLR